MCFVPRCSVWHIVQVYTECINVCPPLSCDYSVSAINLSPNHCAKAYGRPSRCSSKVLPCRTMVYGEGSHPCHSFSWLLYFLTKATLSENGRRGLSRHGAMSPVRGTVARISWPRVGSSGYVRLTCASNSSYCAPGGPCLVGLGVAPNVELVPVSVGPWSCTGVFLCFYPGPCVVLAGGFGLVCSFGPPLVSVAVCC